MIEKVCQQCGIPFQCYPSETSKFCSRLCANRFLGESHKGIPRPKYVGDKISKSKKGRTTMSVKARQLLSEAHRGKSLSKEHSQKISLSLSGLKNYLYGKHLSTEVKLEMSKGHKRAWQNPDSNYYSAAHRAEMSNISRERWQDPNYISKIIKARNTKPNKLEQRLTELLSREFPEFKYNGDYSLGISLAGLIPDFVNVNGKKQVIELFGDYWHSPNIAGKKWRDGEIGKIMAYNSVGYKCLVIWEHELKELSEEELVGKIIKFFRKSRNAHSISHGRL